MFDNDDQERIRAFISYSHSDRDNARLIADTLEKMNIEPLWDRNIQMGALFTEQIKDLIERSHLFIPLITETSLERPWVHQETGYALAINIPILPIRIEGQNLPGDMIAQIQAIVIQSDLGNLSEQLQKVNLDDLIFTPPQRPHLPFEVAESPEERVDLMIRNIKRVTALNVNGWVRHRASSTTFSIPDRQIRDPIWKCRDEPEVRSDRFHLLQRDELKALVRHATNRGCYLVMSRPDKVALQRPPVARRARLESIKEFLCRMSEENLKLMFLPQPENSNLIIVGDYFAAETMAGRAGGWMQTVFNSHPPTVLQRVRRFDQEFEELYPSHSLSVEDAIEEIKKVIETLPSCSQNEH